MAELITVPGFVDMHVHYRDPGYTEAEDFTTGTEAALHDGVILSADMPNNPNFPTNSSAAVKHKIGLINTKAVADVTLYMKHEPFDRPMTDNELERTRDFYRGMSNLGVVGGKAYTNFTTGNPSEVGATPFLKTIKAAVDSNPDWLTVAHVEGRTETNEMIDMVARTIGGRIHIAHARRPELEAVIDFRSQHPDLADRVTAEVTAQHLLMHTGHIKTMGWLAMMKPVLTGREDSEWQKAHLKHVNALATDHAPHPLIKNYWAQVGNPEMDVSPDSGKPTCFGFPSVEVARMAILNLVHEGYLTLDEFVEKTSVSPADILRVKPRKSEVVIDMTPRQLSPDDPVYSKCGYSPLAEAGVMAGGRVKEVLIEGKTVFVNGQIVARPGDGQYVARQEAA